MSDPIVIDPLGFDQSAAWKECSQYVEQYGGLAHPDGEPNWRAAFGDDPGVVSCPRCKKFYWQWGRVQQCADAACGFIYPTDWWPMYSWGSQFGINKRNPPPGWSDPRFKDYVIETHRKRLTHPYYAYGVEHPVEKPFEERELIDWPTVIGNWDATKHKFQGGC